MISLFEREKALFKMQNAVLNALLTLSEDLNINTDTLIIAALGISSN